MAEVKHIIVGLTRAILALKMPVNSGARSTTKRQTSLASEEVTSENGRASLRCGKCVLAQESRVRSTGCSFRPNGVNEYSTRTGISANICLLIRPSRSNSRNCWVRIFCEIRGILVRRAVKRRAPLLRVSHQRITGFQRPPISARSSSIGHLLTMRLALISGSPANSVTRYPFGSWYPMCGRTLQLGNVHPVWDTSQSQPSTAGSSEPEVVNPLACAVDPQSDFVSNVNPIQTRRKTCHKTTVERSAVRRGC
jgi:hypothetical protein